MCGRLNNVVLNWCQQEQVPAGSTSIILRNLMPDTPYTVSVLPVYPAREGKRQSENGRTCKGFFFQIKIWTVCDMKTQQQRCASSASERSGQHEGDQPDHHHAHRHLESCRRQRSGLQSHLCPRRRRAGGCGKNRWNKQPGLTGVGTLSRQTRPINSEPLI